MLSIYKRRYFPGNRRVAMIKRALTSANLIVLLSSVAVSQGGSELSAVPMVIANDKLPEFDVADIKASKDVGTDRGALQGRRTVRRATTPAASTGRQFLAGGRVEFRTLPMKFMILAAWGFENDEGRVTGGPSWMNSEKDRKSTRLNSSHT